MIIHQGDMHISNISNTNEEVVVYQVDKLYYIILNLVESSLTLCYEKKTG